MSLYTERLTGDKPLKMIIEDSRVLNKNIGNGGNRFEKWPTNFLGEVVLKISGKHEIYIEEEASWVKNPAIKIPVSIKTFHNYEDVLQGVMTAVHVTTGLDKPGVMKPGKKLFLLDSMSDVKGKEITDIVAGNGDYYITHAIKTAASIAMWKQLNIILVQKHTRGINNRYYHQDGSLPSCSNCVSMVYKEQEDRPVSEKAYQNSYYCSMTGESLDSIGSVIEYLDGHDHGLSHGHKGSLFLYGNKYVSSSHKVKTGVRYSTQKDIRNSAFEYNAEKCPFYAPKIMLPERAIWHKDLEEVYIPNAIVNFS